MYVPLILVLGGLAIFSFFLFKKDYLSPSFLLSLSFFVSTVSAGLAKVFNWWNDVDLGPIVFWVIVVGILATIVGESLIRWFFLSKKGWKCSDKTKIAKIKIGTIKMILVYLFIIVSLLVVVRQMMNITGVTDNIAQMINKYRNLTPLFNNEGGGVSISTFAMQLVRITNVFGIASVYVFIHNMLAGDRIRHNLKYVGIVVLALTLMFLVGGRTSMVQYIFAGVAFLLVLRRKYTGIRIITKKIKIVAVTCMVLILALFYYVMPLIGRDQVSSMPSYMSYYFGNSVASYQKALSENKLPKGKYFGESFLDGVQQALNKVGLYDDYSAYQSVWVHYKGDTGKTMASNTFTGMEPYYTDGGLIGVIVCQMVYGIVFTCLCLIVMRRNSLFWMILYGFVFVNVFDQMRSESVFSLLSISMVLYIIYIAMIVVLFLPLSEKRSKDMKQFIKMTKKLRFGEIVRRLINRIRVSRLSHPEGENNYVVPSVPASTQDKKYKVVVYTCITGDYDNLSEIKKKSDNFEYFAYLDSDKKNQNGWKIRSIPAINIPKKEEFNNKERNIIENRYLKFHPYELFGDKYDYAIYMDGNIDVIGDLTPLIYASQNKTGLALHKHRQRDSVYNEAKVCKILKKGKPTQLQQQINEYKIDGFPNKYGLFECNVIVVDLKNKNGEKLLKCWWDEFIRAGSMRDQIALPYVMWKNGYSFEDVGLLGDNVFKNPVFSIHEKIHKDNEK